MTPTSPTILIVEDEVLIQDLLEIAFADAGYRVCVLSSGPEAMSYLDACSDCPHALVTDINLGPPPNGWQIGRRARELSPPMAVIYMSGDSSHDWAAHGVADSLMIAKPFATPHVVSAMSALLLAGET